VRGSKSHEDLTVEKHAAPAERMADDFRDVIGRE